MPIDQDKQDKRYTIADIFLVIKKRILVIAMCAVVCAGGAYAATIMVMNKEYTATAIMYVAPSTTATNANSQTPLSELNYLQKIVISYVEVLKTDTFLDSVAQQSNLNYSVDQLRNMILFTVINQTEYFELQVVSDSPVDSLVLANTIARLPPELITEINASDSIRVLSPAKLPTAPSGPSSVKNIVFGLAAGLFLGIVLAFILNSRDRHIKGEGDLLEHFNAPLLGHLIVPGHRMEPVIGEKSNVVSVERYKELLTNLMAEQDLGMKRIMLTSPEPNPAKATNCYNLGIMLARATTAKVLIIDCDYRRIDPKYEADQKNSAIFRYFKLNQVPGLSEMLTSKNKNHKLINKTDYSNLDILCRGNIPYNPADLMGSSAMKELLDTLPVQYDYVLIDTPALNINPDALALSKNIDGVILVVKQGRSTYQDIGLALGSFLINNLKIAGLVLNSEN
jgi:polysaccharide biosynthesis transport protein